MTYQVTLASDGKHAVVISGDDPQEVTDALAWARDTYGDLIGPLGPEAGPYLSADDLGDTPPTCAVHATSMVKQRGRRGYFWSCHQKKDDGSWCSYKPELQ